MNKKYRNTGLIYELLVRKLVEESVSPDSPNNALKMVRKYFTPGSILKEELSLYQELAQPDAIIENEALATELLQSATRARYSINEAELQAQKYNLIGDLKRHYGLKEFFGDTIPTNSYRLQGQIFHLFEGKSSPTNDMKARMGIMEHLTAPKSQTETPSSELSEFMQESEGVREFALNRMYVLFESQYSGMSEAQKRILKAFMFIHPEGGMGLDETVKSELDILIPTLKESAFGYSDLEKTEDIKLKETIKILDRVRIKTHLTEEDVEKTLLALEYVKPQ